MIKVVEFPKRLAAVAPSYSSPDKFVVADSSSDIHDNDKVYRDNIGIIQMNCLVTSYNFIAAGHWSHTTLFNIHDKSVVTRCKNDNVIYCIKISQDGTIIITGSTDNTCRGWNLTTGRELFCYRRHLSAVMCLAFYNNEREILCSGRDGMLHRFTINGTQIKRSFMFNDIIRAIAVSKDNIFITCKTEILILNPKTLESTHILKGYTTQIMNIAISSCENYLVCASATSVGLWDLIEKTLILKFYQHSDDVRSVCFSLDGRMMASVSDDRKLMIYNVQFNIFLLKTRKTMDQVKTVQSFFHAICDILDPDFNDEDESNYFLMRILIYFY